MQIVLSQEFIMDNSHSFSINNVPISTGEKFTVIILRDNEKQTLKPRRKVYAHRFCVENIDLPKRDELYDHQ